jgi:hypothetical protein
VGFIHSAPTFVMVALWAGCDHVGPDVLSAHMAGNDMIHGQAALAFATILAGIIVTAKNFTAGQFDVGARSVNLRLQPNY